MKEKSLSLIDVNTADAATLTQLHGVGSALAERIIAARPFASVGDLQRVSGVGPAFLERVRPQIAISEPAEAGGEELAAKADRSAESEEALLRTEPTPPQEETAPPPTGPTFPTTQATQAQEETTPPPPEVEPDVPAEPAVALPKDDPAPPPPAELEDAPSRVKPPLEGTAIAADKPAGKKEPTLVTRAQALWITFVAGALVFVLAVALSLSVITAINGGLEFADPAQVAEISDQLDGLNRQAGALEQDLEGMRKRLDNLDALSGRLEAIEESTVQLQAGAEDVGNQVDALATQVDDFEQRLDNLEGDVAGLVADYQVVQEQNTRFQEFLDGLRTLLGDLFENEVTQ
jgi:outer membrane murein-binding lipoprotein Lpp